MSIKTKAREYAEPKQPDEIIERHWMYTIGDHPIDKQIFREACEECWRTSRIAALEEVERIIESQSGSIDSVTLSYLRAGVLSLKSSRR